MSNKNLTDIQSKNNELDPEIIFNGTGFQINKYEIPGHIRSLEFQDEYEANLIYAAWLQYTKKDKEANYNTFQWIIKAIFRIIGVTSKWM